MVVVEGRRVTRERARESPERPEPMMTILKGEAAEVEDIVGVVVGAEFELDLRDVGLCSKVDTRAEVWSSAG